ncbi:MAG: hypothetical protein J6Y17_02650 [Elusimicrobiaceae bacterium]|nr:hypothetical protein [Elusimicrobiaceae bacterium]
MKKYFMLIVFFCFGLTACSSFWNAFLETDEGKDFDSYIAKNGVPYSSYQMQNGEIAYSFRKNCSYTRGFEEYMVIVYPNNIIKSISKTQYCPSAPNPPKNK